MQTTNSKKLSSVAVLFVALVLLVCAGVNTASAVTFFPSNPGDVTSAPSTDVTAAPTTDVVNTGGSAAQSPCHGDPKALCNPLTTDSLEGFLLDLVDIFITFAIPIIVLMIIWAGFLYVTARGSEEQVTKATRALTYAIVGGLLILGAKLILEVVKGTIEQIVN